MCPTRASISPDLRGNLETQIANVADELAYTTHDLDDGLRSGMITPRMLEGIALWEILREAYNWRGPELEDMERHRMIRQLVGIMVTDMVEATDKRLRESKAKSALDLQKLKHNVIGYSEDMQRRNRELKDFLYKKLYRHYRVARMQVKAERLIIRPVSRLPGRAVNVARLGATFHRQTWAGTRALRLHRRHDRSLRHRRTSKTFQPA
jgi:dGTPase